MKICLVTTFPPSTGGLSEYGFHIAQELQRNPFLNLTILGDELPSGHSELDGFKIDRCWSFDDSGSALRLLRTLGRLKPDVVWFNLLFSTFGRNPLVAFSGLMTPLLSRLSGRYTHVTLHHLMDTVDLKDVGVKHETLYRAAGAVATRMLLLANSVSVLMPGYRKILNDKYGRDNVHLRSHGILARRPEFPDFSRRAPVQRILAFGKWGTYKRLELMMEAFDLLSVRLPHAKLVVAGGDHPQAPGYTDMMRQLCADNTQVEFRGYVPEDELEDLFQSSTVAVMPYTSSTGCSGVAHLACAYGVPVVCSDLVDFRQMAQAEELAIEFFPPGDAQGLADCLFDLLQNPEKQQTMAAQNFSAALRMTMPNVVQKYLRHFEVQQRVQSLRSVSRFRRLPHWMPTKSLLLRFMTRDSLSWARRSALLHTSWNGIAESQLVQRNGNGRGKLNGRATPGNGDYIGLRNRSGDIAGAARFSPASSGTDDYRNQGADSYGEEQSSAIDLPHEAESQQAETQEPISPKAVPFVASIPGNNGSRSDGQDRSRAPRSGSNGNGSKRTA